MLNSSTLNNCWQAVKNRPRQINDIPQHNSSLARTAATTSAAGLVVASAGFGCVFAWQSGSQHGILLGSLSVLMALALEMCKPLAFASMVTAFTNCKFGRGLALGVLAAVAITYSLSAELSLIATSRGDVVAQRSVVIKAVGDADGDAKRARARYDAAQLELSGLAPSRTIGELQAEIDGTLARVGHDCSVIEDRASGKLCKVVSGAKAELGRAQRRAELEAVLAKPLPVSGPEVNGHVVQAADPAAEALSTYMALLGLLVPAALLSELLLLCPVIGLEVGSSLAGVLVAAYGDRTPAVPVQVAAEAVPEAPALVAPKPRKRRDRTPPPDDKDGPSAPGRKAMGQIVNFMERRGGSFEGSQRDLARLVGISKSWANEALAYLQATGEIVMETSKAGSRIQMAYAA